jgi:hypothetical protein
MGRRWDKASVLENDKSTKYKGKFKVGSTVFTLFQNSLVVSPGVKYETRSENMLDALCKCMVRWPIACIETSYVAIKNLFIVPEASVSQAWGG